MTFLDYSGEEGALCEPAAAGSLELAPQAARPKVHPLTWIAAAVLMPILCWDAWQSLQEAKLRVRTRQSAVQLDDDGRSAYGAAPRAR